MNFKDINPISLLQAILEELKLLRIAYEAVHKPEINYARQRVQLEKHPISRKKLMENALIEELVVDPDWEAEMKGEPSLTPEELVEKGKEDQRNEVDIFNM